MTPSRPLAALAAALIVSACSFTPPQAPGHRIAGSEYQRGKADLAEGNFGLALADFNAALARDPHDIAALNGLGIAYAKLGRDDAARSAFERALALDETSVLTRANYAIFRDKRGDHPEAPQASLVPPQPEPAAHTSPAAMAPPASWPKTMFTISNGSGQSRLARRLQHYLSGRGFPANRTANAARFDHAQSVLYCHAQSRAAADEIRRALPAEVKLVVLTSNANAVELIAGTDLNDFDVKLALAAPVKGAMP